MNISYKWLRRYIGFELNPKELAAVLTSVGLECDTVTEVESIRGGLRGVVIGKVLTEYVLIIPIPTICMSPPSISEASRRSRSCAVLPMWLPARQWSWPLSARRFTTVTRKSR